MYKRQTLKDTTLDRARRTLLKVEIANNDAAEQTIQTLMGKDVEPRFKLIMERAPKVNDVDV